jgi:hypothetical protein
VAVDGGARDAEDVGDLLHGVCAGVVELLRYADPLLARATAAAVARAVTRLARGPVNDLDPLVRAGSSCSMELVGLVGDGGGEIEARGHVEVDLAVGHDVQTV